jgi:hypothetical protein
VHRAAAEQLAQLLPDLVADAIGAMSLSHAVLCEKLDFGARDQARLDAVDLGGGGSQRLLDVLGRRRNRHDAERRALPELLVLDSDTPTLNFCRRSFTRRRTIRLSLSDCA